MKRNNLYGFLQIALMWVLLLATGSAHAYDFYATYEGVRLRYSTNSDYWTVSVIGCDPSTSGAVTIPSSVSESSHTYTVTSISSNAFYNNRLITSVSIPNTVVSIGREAFYSCRNLSEVTLGSGLTTIDYGAFSWDTSLTSIVIPDGVAALPRDAFYHCHHLSSVTLGSGLTFIGACAFLGCPFDSIDIPNTVTQIEFEAFAQCRNLKYVRLPDHLTEIEWNSFCQCYSLERVEIPCGVTTIASHAFGWCSNLESIEIPETVTSIENHAFDSCAQLRDFHFKGRVPPALGNYVFNRTHGGRQLYVPCGCAEAYGNWATDYFSEGQRQEELPHEIVATSCASAMGGVQVECDSVAGGVVITAIAETGYQFLHWNDGDTSNPRHLVPTSDTSFLAIFDTAPYTVEVTSNHASYGIVRGSGSYMPNTVLEIAAIPARGCVFDSWSDGIIANPRTVTIVSDTTFIALLDTTYAPIHDTAYVSVHDTTVVNHYIHDTTILTEYVSVHDTAYVPVHDTTVINHYIHDTTVLTEYVPVHDTAYVPVHDTTVVNHYIHDTTFIPVHDTTYLPYYVHDTAFIPVHDTIYLPYYVEVHDTTLLTEFIHDTLTLLRVDTLYLDTLHYPDTIWAHIQYYNFGVFVNDYSMGIPVGNGMFPELANVEIGAIPLEGCRFSHWNDGSTLNPRTVLSNRDMEWTAYFERVGIDEAPEPTYTVGTARGEIILRGAPNRQVRILDLHGRQLLNERNLSDEKHYRVPSTGAYFLQVDGLPARKVVVME